MPYSEFLKRGYIGEHYRDYEGDARNLDYCSYAVISWEKYRLGDPSQKTLQKDLIL